MIRFRPAALAILCLLLGSGQAPAQTADKSARRVEWTAQLIRTEAEEQIGGLQFPSKKIPVLLRTQETQIRPLVELRFFFDRPGWSIQVYGQNPKKGLQPNEYVVFAYLNSQMNEIQFTAKGPEGKFEKESLILFAPEAQEFQIMTTWNTLSFSFGLSQITYKQSRFGVFNSQSGILGIKASAPESSSRWGWTGDLYMTVLTLKSAPVAANPQAIDGSAALTLRLPLQEQTRWRHRLTGGMSYLALLSNGSSFGFSGLISTELGWSSTYFRDTNNSYGLDFRLSPLKGFSLDNQRIYQLGANWVKTLPSSRRQELGARLLNSKFESNFQDLELTVFSLTLGYTF